jgi:hypothetical protein
MENLDWNELDRKGLYPGPHETEEDWRLRVQFCLSLKKNRREWEDFPFSSDAMDETGIALEEGMQVAKNLFNISPEWVPVIFSNDKLAPWHGGCAWIFQQAEGAPTAALMQLRSSLRTHDHYLQIYQRKELVAHELVHAGRMMFDEPQYEEILAYRTSALPLRRWLGPLIQSAWEGYLFVGVAALTALIQAGLLLYDAPFTWFSFIGLFVIVLAALLRLAWRQNRYSQCLKKLQQLQAGEPLMVRLTDFEINHFASSSIEGIGAYWENEAKRSFRGKFLSALYLPKILDYFEREMK